MIPTEVLRIVAGYAAIAYPEDTSGVLKWSVTLSGSCWRCDELFDYITLIVIPMHEMKPDWLWFLDQPRAVQYFRENPQYLSELGDEGVRLLSLRHDALDLLKILGEWDSAALGENEMILYLAGLGPLPTPYTAYVPELRYRGVLIYPTYEPILQELVASLD